MSDDRSVERRISAWLEEEASGVLPDRVLDSVFELTRAAPRRRWPFTGRLTQMSRSMSALIAVGAAAIVVVIVGAVLLGSRPSVGGRSPSPSAGPSAVALYLPKMTQGVVYRTPPFTPSFTITGVEGWYLVAPAGPGTVFFAKGPNEPAGPDDLSVALIHPTQVLPVGGGSAQALPTDVIAWLRARPDLVLQDPKTALVGGMPARVVDGTVVPTAKVNQNGEVSLLCTAGPCGFEFGDELAVAPGRHFEIMVADVRGQTVVIRIDSPESTWTSGRHELDDFLSTMTFPT